MHAQCTNASLSPHSFAPFKKRPTVTLFLRWVSTWDSTRILAIFLRFRAAAICRAVSPFWRQHSHIFTMHSTRVLFNAIHGEIRITINLWHRWTNMAFVHLLIVHSFSSYWHCWTNLAYIHFFLTDHTVIVHRKLLLLLNKLGLGTLYPDCTVVSHITAGEHTWHMYTSSWLYSCCSYYCRWTNLAYVHFILTVQLFILLLVNKLGIYVHFILTDCTVIVPTDAAERTWHMYTFSWLYSYCSYWHCWTSLAPVHLFLNKEWTWHVYTFS